MDPGEAMTNRAGSKSGPEKLQDYGRKRDFGRTPEPRGRSSRKRSPKRALGFVVQRHAARHVHYDFRLEYDGVLKSWAVPKGPSLVVGERRMAVQTEDHPLDYADFEGEIPKGEYGGGTVEIWDRGTWEPVGDPAAGFDKGHLEFRVAGDRLKGRWHLVRMKSRAKDRGKSSWLIIKASDPEVSGPATPRARANVESISAPRSALPNVVTPQLATLVTTPPEGTEWLHEIKFDGYRALARIDRGNVLIRTRSGHDWTHRFAALAAELADIPVDRALIDGEVVVLNANGRSDFQALQRAIDSGGIPLHYYAFDLLHANGRDLRNVPLEARREVLSKVIDSVPASSSIHFSRHVVGDGLAFFEEVCRNGGEGIVSKRADSVYRSARTRTWVKSKCGRRQEFVIVGYTDPRRSRIGLGALLLGVYTDDGRLHYAGKVGTGFSDKLLVELHARLATLARSKASVVDPERAERGAHWVKPTLVAEVEFSEWTQEDRIRHPTFIALRTDKPAKAIRRESPTLPPSRSRPRPKPPVALVPSLLVRGRGASRAGQEVAGIRLTHPDRVYFPELGLTKLELARYYEAMADRILPGLAQRPLSLVRCPEGRTGKCFYQKHVDKTVSESVGRVVIEKDESPYAMVTDLPSLIALVQISVIEFHVWGSRADQIEKPDQIVIDLDPDETVSWPRLVEAVRLVRALLEELGLVPFLRTTGGKGLHVVAPLVRRTTWESVKGFTHALALRMTREKPEEYTDRISKSRRKGKILIDYLRNQRDATAIASYSVRARPNAPVAMPIAWEELDQARKMPQWSVRNAPDRLALPDPWKDFDKSRRVLTNRARQRIESG